MIPIETVKVIHERLIEEFGGAKYIRNEELLESSLARPFSTFDAKDLYPTVTQKAAALLESIVVNHPFIDGNKRTGYVLMRLLLLSEDTDIEASQDEKYDLVIQVSKGDYRFEDILKWIEEKKYKK